MQVGEAQEAHVRGRGGFDGKFPRFRTRVGYGRSSVRDVVRYRIEPDRFGPPERRIDYISRGRVSLAGVSELMQIVSLDFEEAVSIVVVRRSRQSTLASRNTSSRSTAD